MRRLFIPGFAVVFAAAVLAGVFFRTVRLDLRPMHHDEANQAVKFGGLLEEGEYRYDPDDHHGPTLYYLTLPFARIAGRTTLAGLDETVLRLVPALFGVGIILLLLLFKGAMPREALAAAGLLVAVSPAMTYYSRFYIQETLLVFFLVGAAGCAWRWHAAAREPEWTGGRIFGPAEEAPAPRPKAAAAWAAGAGFFCGLMYATKETSVILFGAAGGALILVGLLERKKKKRGGRLARHVSPGFGYAAAFGAAAFAPAWLLYTSFLENRGGFVDSLLAFGGYLERASGGTIHDHPWHFYFSTLIWSRTGAGPVWSEGFVIALAAAGAFTALGAVKAGDADTRFSRALLFFTLGAAAVYSVIPYKTPWNLLPFFMGLILLAGNGTAVMMRISRFLAVRALVVALLAPGFVNLGLQAWRANDVYSADPRNPYVYAQTVPDFLKLVKRVDDIAEVSTDGRRMLIMVVAPPEETWPLPWSLREYERVGYWTDTAAVAGIDIPNAPFVIAGLDAAEELGYSLEDTHQAEFYGLRPEVHLVIFIRRDLWEAYLVRMDKQEAANRRDERGHP
jgi:uncharacterized protein (TIGR03663 family)